MSTVLVLLRTLARILEEVADAGLIRELALHLRRRRLAAAESALEARNERLARALVDGDVETIDALIVGLEHDLDDVLLPDITDKDGGRGEE